MMTSRALSESNSNNDTNSGFPLNMTLLDGWPFGITGDLEKPDLSTNTGQRLVVDRSRGFVHGLIFAMASRSYSFERLQETY